MTSTATLPDRRPPRWLPSAWRGWRDVTAILAGGAWPALDLVIRIWIGQTFLLSGLVKLASVDNAVLLATSEYPVSWLDPVAAAALGMAIEVLGGLMLLLGLGTRAAAIALAVLSLVIQTVYLELPEHLFWAILCGWYAVAGPGPLSFDRLFGAGFASLPLPLVARLGELAGFSRRRLVPFALLGIRIWIAMIFFAAGATKFESFENTTLLFEYEYMVPLLPPAFAAAAATVFELSMPVLLVLGLFTRLATLPLIVMTLVIQFTYMHHIDHLYWLMLLGLVALRGPGRLSLDHLLGHLLEQRYPDALGQSRWDDTSRPHVVIVGAGFGGVAAAQGLRHTPCRITLIDRRNYHLFQPLLYQVATAALSPADIASPIREIFRSQPNVRVLMGRVTGVDREGQAVLLGERRIPFDHLVLGTGARHAYFGRDDWEVFAPGLKKIPDATELRGRILNAFEQAEATDDAAERACWMTFVIVGGGPTGVELAGAIAELARHGLAGEFRNARPELARIILVQSGDRLLPPFPPELSERTRLALQAAGVEVHLNARVTGIDAAGVTVGDEPIPARTVLWAAGVMASPAGKWLGCDRDRAGRIVVDDRLTVPGTANIHAIGDTAASNGWDGQPVPGLAPAAKQGGAYVARLIHARITGGVEPAPFRYRHAGNLATIGRAAAVADLGRIRLSGPLAWWFWGAVHVMFLTSVRDRVSVAIEWAWAYLTFRRSNRLITEPADTAAD
ncbi:MAG: FAD-dependent oxidoreductase [Pseudomonadota bacterium]|nr:FAD-dependent oxidoreductase [Pseudomonadota bacterium]